MSYKKPDEIKKEINLLDYAVINNYKINKNKSSIKWISLENQITGDKILVNTSNNMYFSKIDDNDKGDVIQFKANRINGNVMVDKTPETFYKALQELNSSLGYSMIEDNKILLNDKNKFIEKRETLSKIQDKEWNHIKMNDYKFLTQNRCIDQVTLEHPIFENRLFNTFFKLKNDHLITNYGFGKYIKNELVGLEVRNDTLKNIIGNHDGIFITNTEGMNKIDLVFYAESAIDAISYFEILLKHNSFDESKRNYCFLSFGGNLYESKINVIMEHLSTLPISNNAKFISITDNDLDKAEEKKEGKKYDVMMTTALLKREGLNIDLALDNELYYKISIDNVFTDESLQNIIKLQNNYIDNTVDVKDRYGKYLICKDIDTRKELHFPKKIDLDHNGFNDFLKLLGKEHLYIAHKSKTKDWNDDLKSIKKNRQVYSIKSTEKKTYGIKR